jgi:hypothetical protein
MRYMGLSARWGLLAIASCNNGEAGTALSFDAAEVCAKDYRLTTKT